MRQFKVTKSITNRNEEAMKLYLKDVSHIPMISKEEEIELAERIQQGDKKALDKLVTANLRFVISVAKQYQGQGLDLLDLINEGNVGLMTAASKFDPSKGFKFISYAVWWIRQSIIAAISNNSRTIRLPISQAVSLTKILKTINTFEQENQRVPSDSELEELLGIDIEKINGTLTSNHSCISVETPFGSEGDEGCLLDVLENHNSPHSDKEINSKDREGVLESLLSKFSDRDSDIIRIFFGLTGVQSLPLDEIGKRFGLTSERIRQIKDKTLATIRTQYSQLASELYV